MKRRLRFTIYHGFAVSLALHSTVAVPLVLQSLTLPEERSRLVIDLQGLVSDRQAEEEEKVTQETKEAPPPTREARAERPTEQPQQTAVEAARQSPQPIPEDRPKEVVADDGDRPLPAEPVKSAPTPLAPPPPETPSEADTPVVSADRSQVAQTIEPERDVAAERLRDYVKVLTKKVQDKLVYPKEGRRANERRKAGLLGTASVAFTILPDGQIRQESLRVVTSSGQPVLDASALKAIRASAPFDPPPRVMTLTIPVDFERYE